MVEPAHKASEEEHKRVEHKRTTKGTGPSVQAEEGLKIGGDLKMGKNPAFIQSRKQVFEELFEA